MQKQRVTRILDLALPIIAAMVSQSLLNLVDTAMVGTLGDAALAAVGMGGFTLFMCQAVILGVSTAVQAIASRRKGQGRLHESASILNAGLLLVITVAPVISVLFYLLAPVFYPYLNSDPEVIALGLPYFQIRILATVFIGANYAFRGYWNAVDLSRIYMSTLLVVHACNIFLNYVLIFGHFGAPAMGVSGCGLASAISVALGSCCHLWLGIRYAGDKGFLRLKPSASEIKTLVSQAIPGGLQHFSVMAGMVVLYWIIGRIGTAELAAASVLLNIMTVAILPAMGFAMASATLVGQALGKNDIEDASQWTRESVKVGALVMLLLGLPMILLPELILSIFLHEPDSLALAKLPVQIIGATVIIEGIKRIFQHSLMGAGDTKRVMWVTVLTQWVFFTPLAYLIGPVLGMGLLGVWITQEVYRLLQMAIFYQFWQQKKWAAIRL